MYSIHCGKGDDLAAGGAGNDVVSGGVGNDDLRGGLGKDIVAGGSGDDTLRGAAGDDRLTGGKGADLITTGSGRDTVFYRQGDGSDTVTDFTVKGKTSDVIDLTGFSAIRLFSDLAALLQDKKAGATLRFNKEDKIVLQGLEVKDLKARHFVFENNRAPEAVDDGGVGFETDEDTAFTTASVIGNDTDPDNDSLTVTARATKETIGKVTRNPDGTFEYDPNGKFEDLAAGETARDSFTYTVSAGRGGTDTATVTITIQGRDEPELETQLANDTGRAADDQITRNPALEAQLSNDAPITSLLVAVNSGDAVDVAIKADGEGGVLVSRKALEAAFGTSIPEGDVTLTLQAVTADGTSGMPVDLAFNFDRPEPSLTDLGLAVSSDT